MRPPHLPPVRASRALGSRAARAFVTVWLVVHSVFVVGLPVMDGLLGHADVEAHWEDQSDRDCPPRHDPESCGLCHLVSHASAEPVKASPPPAVMRRATVAPARVGEGRPRGVLAVDGAGPRGPPLG